MCGHIVELDLDIDSAVEGVVPIRGLRMHYMFTRDSGHPREGPRRMVGRVSTDLTDAYASRIQASKRWHTSRLSMNDHEISTSLSIHVSVSRRATRYPRILTSAD